DSTSGSRRIPRLRSRSDCLRPRPPRRPSRRRNSRTSAAWRCRSAASPAPRGCTNSGIAPCRPDRGPCPGFGHSRPRRARGKVLLHERLVSSWVFPFGDNALLQRVVPRREKARHLVRRIELFSPSWASARKVGLDALIFEQCHHAFGDAPVKSGVRKRYTGSVDNAEIDGLTASQGHLKLHLAPGVKGT